LYMSLVYASSYPPFLTTYWLDNSFLPLVLTTIITSI